MTTKAQIISAITEAQTALSAKGVAEYLGIDATSEALNKIRESMWEMAGAGTLKVYDLRDNEKAGGLFFGLPFSKESTGEFDWNKTIYPNEDA